MHCVMMIMMMTVAVVVVEHHFQCSTKVEDPDIETSCTGDIYWNFINFTMANISTIPG
jgi:hypothetical protein